MLYLSPWSPALKSIILIIHSTTLTPQQSPAAGEKEQEKWWGRKGGASLVADIHSFTLSGTFFTSDTILGTEDDAVEYKQMENYGLVRGHR